MPIAFPLLPTIFSHPNVVPASILTLAETAAGRTLSLYASDCSLKSSQETKETSRTAFPSFLSSSAALAAISSSEPVPIKITSGLLPEELSERMYPPFSTPSMEVPGRFGNFCRERARMEGLFRLSTATLYAPAVSLPSAGRSINMFGIALKLARCSIG
ncbi:hypothetical protein IC582_027471 [Cucumis melo]